MQLPPDYQARDEALNPRESFIVQAPAGSGKTEALTQRYLNLLAYAHNAPEEIIALTFTNKAANEMHHRIYQALLDANSDKRPNKAHKAKTYDLANSALQNSQGKGWDLLNNPKRLRITTIDAFCQFLASKLMFESEDGFSAKITDTPDKLYEQALENLLAETDEACPWFSEISSLMLHLDNDWQRLKGLLSRMLSKREQWLPVVFSLQLHNRQAQGKNAIELGFHQVIHTNMQACYEILFTQAQSEDKLLEILNYCSGDQQYITLAPEVDNLAAWQALIKLLFTDKSIFRKTFNARDGLPAKDPKAKQYIQWLKQYIESFSDQAMASLVSLIDELSIFKSANFTQDQWQLLSDISSLAIHAVSYLKLMFQQKSELDFNEVTLQALSALGNIDQPTDLALYLDYQIQHILIDEFQDTSVLQFKLLEMLTYHWHQGDGKTLFIVGDPMQSIYRFRQAEVNLFLQVKQKGIGQLQPRYLQLTCNFRSNKSIVDWVNDTFSQIFPVEDVPNYGGISYSFSQTLSQSQDGNAIQVRSYQNIEAEALAIANEITQFQLKDPQASIAILVRSRSHLKTLVPVLKSQGIALVENEIETLYDQMPAKDLLALSCILTNPFEPYYWLSLLTSELFSFSLQDLLPLSETIQQENFYQSLRQYANTHGNNKVALDKLNAFLQQIDALKLSQASSSLVTRLKIVWQLLDGDLIYPQSHSVVDSYVMLLQHYLTVDQTALVDVKKLIEKMQLQYVSSVSAGNVEVMTIHKSKGLEFDFVIIPQLHKLGKAEASDLFLYEQLQLADQQSHLLLSPIKHSWDQKSPALYQAIAMIQRKRAQYELQRLLYVACTRTKQKLWLSAMEQEKAPAKDSLLALLTMQDITEHVIKQAIQQDQIPIMPRYRSVKAIDNFTHLDSNELGKLKIDKTGKENVPCLSEIFLDDERLIGTILHHVFDYVIKHNLTNTSDLWQQYFQQLLRQYALGDSGAQRAQKLIGTALQNTWQKHAWIFTANGMSEQVMQVGSFSSVTKRIADRVIVDEKGVSVIDYKFSMPAQGISIEEFIKEQILRYQDQVQNYRSLLASHYQLSIKDIKGFLYFPLLPKLVTASLL